MKTMHMVGAGTALLLALGSGCGDDDTAATASPGSLPALHATRGDDPAIFDELGRQVLLRGVNLNSLGDYYQASPQLPPVFELQPEFFAEMAAQGFNVVRLLLSWSALEPERDRIDTAYLDRVRAAVDAAAANGVYVVLDMHQEAWGKFIATPAGTECGFGAERRNGRRSPTAATPAGAARASSPRRSRTRFATSTTTPTESRGNS